jgi:hypothetical protein
VAQAGIALLALTTTGAPLAFADGSACIEP